MGDALHPDDDSLRLISADSLLDGDNYYSASKAPSGGEKSLQKKKRPAVEGKPTSKATAPPVVIRAATDDADADGGDSSFIMVWCQLLCPMS